MATTQERIDQINEILAAGIESTTRGGREIKYDLDALAKERDRLQNQLNRAGTRGPSIRTGIYNPDFGDV